MSRFIRVIGVCFLLFSLTTACCLFRVCSNSTNAYDDTHLDQPVFGLDLSHLLSQHVDDVVSPLGSRCIQPNNSIVQEYCIESIDWGSVNAIEIAFEPNAQPVAEQQLVQAGAEQVRCGVDPQLGYRLGSSVGRSPSHELVLLIRDGTARLMVTSGGYCRVVVEHAKQ